MKMKKIISVVLACACVFSFAACGSKSDSSKSDSAKSDKKEKLVMATNAEFPPFEYYDGDEVVGIDAEFAAAIADKLGMDLKIKIWHLTLLSRLFRAEKQISEQQV